MANKTLVVGLPETGLTNVGVTIRNANYGIVVPRTVMSIGGEFKPYWYRIDVDIPEDFEEGYQEWDDSTDSDIFLSEPLKMANSETFGNIFTSEFLATEVNNDYEANTVGGILFSLKSGKVVHSSFLFDAGVMTLIRGDDYLLVDGKSLDFVDTGNNWPVLTGSTIEFSTGKNVRTGMTPVEIQVPCTILKATGSNKAVRLELHKEVLNSLQTERYYFAVQATLSTGSKHTLFRGILNLVEGPVVP